MDTIDINNLPPIVMRRPDESVFHSVIKNNTILCSGELTAETSIGPNGAVGFTGKGYIADGSKAPTCERCLALLKNTDPKELQRVGYIGPSWSIG